MPKGRTRTFAIVAVVLAAVALLIGLPLYLTAQPGFFSRYESLQPKVTPMLTSTHAEATCADCHVSPGLFARTGYRTRMVGEFYLGLVARDREPALFGRPSNDACLACHSDLRSVSPKGDLKIPHRAHVNILKMECVQCHNYLVHEKSPEGKHAPPMSGCLTCHNGDKAKDSCSACHTNKAAPVTHQSPDWLVVHAQRAQEPECDSCHAWTDAWCVDCHQRRPASHVKEWRATHGDAIRQHRSCEACHEQAFCVRCHGEFPKENLNPALDLVE